MTKLHELTAAYKQLETMIDDPEYDVSTYLAECQGAIQEKAINIIKLVQNLDATVEAMKAAENRMSDRRKSIENRIESIKDYVKHNMQNSGVHKIECEYFVLTVKNAPPKVVITDEKEIPLQYWRQPEPPPMSIDKKAIAADIKEGVVVSGAHTEQGQYLVIK